ncbi:hypothetical protein SLS53_007393 [Cytospora paraplurivora]|uniref:Uncharacterized protein n=1 Tax=Cytospora paraplurivora TaxID=2898453 RepID=A0AAN9U0R6_9PEZI
MAPLTEQELNDRKVEAKRVVAGRTQLAQAIRDQAQQWIDNLRQKDYDHEKPSRWFTPYRVITKTKDKNTELCAAAFVAIEAMQEVRGTFPRFKVHNKEIDFPYIETASALKNDLREHRYWAQFCVPPPQTSSLTSEKAAGKRKALTSSRPRPPVIASSQHSTMSPPSNLHQPSYAVPSQEIRSQYQPPVVPAKRQDDSYRLDTRPAKKAVIGDPQRADSTHVTEHFLVPSVDAVKSLPLEARRMIVDLQVIRLGIGQVMFTEPIDLSNDQILENVAGNLVKVVSPTTVTLLDGNITGYRGDGSARHPLLQSFRFSSDGGRHVFEVDMQSQLDSYRDKVGTWEFTFSPNPSSLGILRFPDRPWIGIPVTPQLRDISSSGGLVEQIARPSLTLLVQHVTPIFVQEHEGRIRHKPVQFVGITQFFQQDGCRFLVALSKNTRRPCYRYWSYQLSCERIVKLRKITNIGFSDFTFFQNCEGMRESQVLDFFARLRDKQPLMQAREAAMKIDAHATEDIAKVTDELYLVGGNYDSSHDRCNPWVVKSTGNHSNRIPLLFFQDLLELLQFPPATDNNVTDSHIPADEGHDMVQYAQPMETVDDSDSNSQAKFDPKDEEDYIPPFTTFSRGRKVAPAFAAASYPKSSSPLHDDQGLVNSIERQGDSHRQLFTVVKEEDPESAADQASPPEGQSNDRPPSPVEEPINQPQMSGQVLEVLQAMVTGMEERMEARLEARLEARMDAFEDRIRGHYGGT